VSPRQENSDRVGTAIAHATLYQELELARNEAEEANHLKSNCLASTTHELPTPLNGIIGFLQKRKRKIQARKSNFLLLTILSQSTVTIAVCCK